MIFWKLFRGIYEIAAEKMCQEIAEFVERGEKILDFGCGSGILAKKLKEKFDAKILGIDIKDNRVFKIPFQIFDGKKIPFPEDSFDTILISFVLHHTKDPIEILKEAKRVAKKTIIFEDIAEGIFGKVRMAVHLLTFGFFIGEFPKIKILKEKDWEKIFENLGFKILAKRNFKPPLYFLDPIKRKIFVLKK